MIKNKNQVLEPLIIAGIFLVFLDAYEVFSTWNNFRQKETHNELITAYGYGDGGGGPTRSGTM